MAQKFLSDIHATAGVKDSSGDLGTSGQVLSSTGSLTNWVNPTVGTTVIYKDAFTATNGQTAFTLANTVDSEDKTQVYIDGAYQSKGGYTVSGTTLTFDTGLETSSEVEVMTFSTATANNAASAVKLDTFTGDGSDLTFVLSEAVVDEKVTQVYINGVYQNKSTYSIAADLVTLTFGSGNAPPNSSAIEVISFKTITSTDGTLTATTFLGDLNGTINTATTATTQSAGNNSTKISTTAYTDAKVADAINNGTTAIAPSQNAVFDALALKANLAGPTFTGTPAAPTASAGTNTTQLATTAFVTTGISNIVDSSPAALNTLNELAAALGDDANFSTTVTNSIATKLPLAGGTLTGALVGTSATFSNSVTADQGIFNSTANTYTGGSLILRDLNGANPMYLTSVVGNLAISNGGATDHLIISTGGDATFSKDVFINNTNNNPRIELKQSGTTAGYFAIASGVNSIVNGSVSGDMTFRAVNKSVLFSVDNGVSSALTIKSDGKVGIGTASTAGRVDVRMNMSGQSWIPDGTSAKWGEVWDSGGTPGSKFNNSVFHLNTNRLGGVTGGVVGLAFSPGWQGHQNWGIYSWNNSGGTYTEGDLSFVNQINNGTIQERMRISSNGQVRIGNAFNTNGVLDIQFDAAVLNAPRITDTRSFAINQGGGIDFMGQYSSTTTNTKRFGSIYGKKENSTNGNFDGYLQFQTNNVERLRISSLGNVGIGTTSPGNTKLDVVMPNSNGTSRQEILRLLQTSQNTLSCYMYGGSTDLVQLHVHGAEQNLSLTTGGTASATTATGIHLRSGGDVGIGTISPTEKLEVVGAIRVKRKVLAWYQVVVPDNTSYWHIKTSLWSGGSPSGNTHYTMSHLHAELYSFGNATIREGRQGWHNWAGTQYGVVNTGNIWSNPYTSSDGYVVLVLNTSGSYVALSIDWSQVYTYTYVDIHAQAASGSSNTTGVY